MKCYTLLYDELPLVRVSDFSDNTTGTLTEMDSLTGLLDII